MRKYAIALVIAATLAATAAAVPALYAEDNQSPSGPMMRGGMMGDDNNGADEDDEANEPNDGSLQQHDERQPSERPMAEEAAFAA